MGNLREVVDITITQETRTVAVQNFGQMLVVGPNVNYHERVVTVDSLAAAEELLTGGDAAPEYLKVREAFAQNNAPDSVLLGVVRGNRVLTFDSGTYTAGAITGVVGGVAISVSYHTDKATTLADVATAIAAADTTNIASATLVGSVITVVPASGMVCSVTLDITGITGTMTLTPTSPGGEDYDDALDAIQLVSDDWYQLVIDSIDDTDVLAVAAWVEANDSPKLYGMASSDANIVNQTVAGDTTSIAHQLKALARDRTIGFYHGEAGSEGGNVATEALEAAYFGAIGGLAPGSYNGSYMQPKGVTADALNITQERNARGYYSTGSNSSFHIAKECNCFTTLAGFNIIQFGRTFGGSWVDFLIFKDWLIAALKAAVYGVIVNSNQVPYDLKGFAMIEGAMEQVFKQAQKNGAVPEFWYDDEGNKIPAYTITFPNIYEVSTADFTDRILNNLKWTCYYTKKINAIRMNGTFA